MPKSYSFTVPIEPELGQRFIRTTVWTCGCWSEESLYRIGPGQLRRIPFKDDPTGYVMHIHACRRDDLHLEI